MIEENFCSMMGMATFCAQRSGRAIQFESTEKGTHRQVLEPCRAHGGSDSRGGCGHTASEGEDREDSDHFGGLECKFNLRAALSFCCQ